MIKKINILKQVLGANYRSRDENLFYCPFCKHHKKKLSVNIDKSVFKCWVCNTKGSISYLIRRFGSIDDRHQWELLNQEVDFTAIDSMFDAKPKEAKQVTSLPNEYICLARKHLPPSARDPLAYLMSRGLSKQDILYYKIGYCPHGEYRKRIIIPSFNENGDCDFFIARTYRKDWLKYKNPPVSKNIIFNELLIDWKNPVTIVEGVFDAIKIDNSIPLLGSTMMENSILFQRIAMEQPKIYIGLDHDALYKSLNIITSMIQYGLEVYLLNTTQIEDIGSISKYEAERLKEDAKIMNTENIFDICWRN